MTPATSSVFPCHVCGSAACLSFPEYAQFQRVTSDCKPWPSSGQLGVCEVCSSVQANTDERWSFEADQIYQQYTIYHQAKGAEQSVFDQSSGQAVSRSARLVERFQNEIRLPTCGRLLDIGCGNGAFLRACSGRMNGWSMAGVEVNDHYREQVESIAGVEALFTCPPGEVPGRFDVISLIHVLEHIPSPRQYLLKLWDKLNPGGLLVIEVPDCEQNPFMFLIADHASHCFLGPLTEWVASAGYAVVRTANNWIPKELTVVARKSNGVPADRPMRAGQRLDAAVRPRLEWLSEFASHARDLAGRARVGVFGTSIAGTWLFAEMNGGVEFFVDEDPNRIGQTQLGKRIISPAQIPEGSEILLPMPPLLAGSVAARLSDSRARLHLPPAANWTGIGTRAPGGAPPSGSAPLSNA